MDNLECPSYSASLWHVWQLWVTVMPIAISGLVGLDSLADDWYFSSYLQPFGAQRNFLTSISHLKYNELFCLYSCKLVSVYFLRLFRTLKDFLASKSGMDRARLSYKSNGFSIIAARNTIM